MIATLPSRDPRRIELDGASAIYFLDGMNLRRQGDGGWRIEDPDGKLVSMTEVIAAAADALIDARRLARESAKGDERD